MPKKLTRKPSPHRGADKSNPAPATVAAAPAAYRRKSRSSGRESAQIEPSFHQIPESHFILQDDGAIQKKEDGGSKIDNGTGKASSTVHSPSSQPEEGESLTEKRNQSLLTSAPTIITPPEEVREKFRRI